MQLLLVPTALAAAFTGLLTQADDGRWSGTTHDGHERLLTIAETHQIPDVTSFVRDGRAVIQRDRLGGRQVVLKSTEVEAEVLFAAGPWPIPSR